MSISESVIALTFSRHALTVEALIVVAVLVWLACGFVAMGFNYATFQRRFPLLAEKQRSEMARYALCDLLWGPAALMTSFQFGEYRNGWLLPWRKP